jgi:HSP20 family protein
MAKGKNNHQTAKAKSSETGNRATKGQMVAKRETDPNSWLPAPTNLVRCLRDEMDRLFQDFGLDSLTRGLPDAESIGLRMWAPEVEVFERDGEIVVRADLPGLTRDEISIDLTESAITIDGTRKQERKESDDGYYRSERSYGRFYRRIPLPDGVDIDAAKAQFRDGVLEVSFAVPEPTKRKVRKIEIADEPVASRARSAGR